MFAIIKSQNYADEPMTLVDAATFAAIREGDTRPSRVDEYVVTGGRAPHKRNGSGLVDVTLTPFGNFCQSMREQREPAYSDAELVECWGSMSIAEQREWIDRDMRTIYPSVVGAVWMHDATLDAAYAANVKTGRASLAELVATTMPHAEAPATIRAVNQARRKARRSK